MVDMPVTANLLTVDLEEWFVVETLSGRFSRVEWEKLETTVIKNTHRLLQLFQNKDVTATWFVLGWVAKKYPALIKEIFHEGHEIACHSFNHIRVNSMDPESFRKDTELALEAITNATGKQPVGYRAPSWSIDDSTPWAFDILCELGFEYDSSIYPIKHDIYGIPKGPRHTFKMNLESGRTIYEIPASTYRILGHNFPVAGGGFLRNSPYWYTKLIINSLNNDNHPAIVYLHPWEIDRDPPRLEGLTMVQKFRTYGSTSVFYYKLERLLSDFDFINMSEYIRNIRKKRHIGFHVD